MGLSTFLGQGAIALQRCGTTSLAFGFAITLSKQIGYITINGIFRPRLCISRKAMSISGHAFVDSKAHWCELQRFALRMTSVSDGLESTRRWRTPAELGMALIPYLGSR